MIPGIQLTHDEWLYASWRPREVLVRPAETSFRRRDVMKRLGEVRQAWRFSPWREARWSAAMSREEATFWLHAMIALQRDPRIMPDALQELAASWNIGAAPDEERGVDSLLQGDSPSTAGIVLLERIYGWPAAVRFAERVPHESGADDNLRRVLLPFVSDEEAEPLRAVIRRRASIGDCPGALLALAAVLNMPDVIRACMPGVSGGPERMLNFGLTRDELLSRRELLIGPGTVDEAIAWIAHTGADHLDWIVNRIVKDNAAGARPFGRMLAQRLSGAEAAPHLLVLLERNRGAAEAGRWLQADPERARRGLEGYDWKPYPKFRPAMRRAAAVFLRPAMARTAVMEKAIGLPADLAHELKTAGESKWKSPKWLDWNRLPSIQVGGGALDSRAVCAGISTISVDPLKDNALTKLVRVYGDAASIEPFVIGLVEAWRVGGAPASDRWALGAVGLLGGEAAGLLVLGYKRAWGTRLPLLRLGERVLQRVSTPALLWRALVQGEHRLLNAVAEETGEFLSRLCDRILPVPVELVVDYGPRRFTLTLDAEANSVFVADNGQRLERLPKPGRRDDGERAEAAFAAGTAAAKENALIRKFALQRFERAWRTHCAWSREEFEGVLTTHPVYRRLARLMVWMALDDKLEPMATFRITEDGSYADSADRAWTWPEAAAHVMMPRPSQIGGGESLAWAQVFADYRVLPLLTQFIEAGPEMLDGFGGRRALSFEGECSRDALEQGVRAAGYTQSGSNWKQRMPDRNLTVVIQTDDLGHGRVCADVSFYRCDGGNAISAIEADWGVVHGVLRELMALNLFLQS